LIKIDELTRRYGELTAVDAVSIDIARGEVVGLLGHNGAGKTTIMKMLTGFLEPTAGSIVVDGLRVGAPTAAVRRRIGYLPENCPLWPEMTVLELLEYAAALHDVPLRSRRQAIASALQRTELRDKALATIATLSRGYRQRVGVAQAILHSPDIVVLDEPTNGLDPTQILHMRALIGELAQRATVIVSTHILQEVQAVCGRVVILRAGQKVVDARLADLQRNAGLRLTVDRGPEQLWPVVQSVPGAGQLRLLGSEGGRYHYALEAAEALAPQLAAAVHGAGIALAALYPEQRTLETVFAEVNAAGTTGQRHAA
jgi:ABC-2 type transport system ATP-binding protein